MSCHSQASDTLEALTSVRRSGFAANDVVRHVCGGPDMFVEGPGTDVGQVWCSWHSGRLYHAGSFNEKLLIRVTSREKADVTQFGNLDTLFE